jgi:TPR repeat protein
MARIIAAAVGRAEHARPDVLAVSSSEDEHEPTLFADALRSVQDHEFSAQTFSFSRRVLLLLTGIAAITLTIWLIAPWIAPWVHTSLVSFAPSSGPQSAEASPSRNSYTGTSARDLRGFALRGDAAAQYALGMRYASGDGVKQDYHEALVWFLKSADQGNARAASKLAAFFWSGRGSPRDYGKAYFWGLLAQAAGDEQGRVIVINSAPHLSPAQTAQEQQQADKWLHDHHIQSSSEAAQ